MEEIPYIKEMMVNPQLFNLPYQISSDLIASKLYESWEPGLIMQIKKFRNNTQIKQTNKIVNLSSKLAGTT